MNTCANLSNTSYYHHILHIHHHHERVYHLNLQLTPPSTFTLPTTTSILLHQQHHPLCLPTTLASYLHTYLQYPKEKKTASAIIITPGRQKIIITMVLSLPAHLPAFPHTYRPPPPPSQLGGKVKTIPVSFLFAYLPSSCLHRTTSTPTTIATTKVYQWRKSRHNKEPDKDATSINRQYSPGVRVSQVTAKQEAFVCTMKR